MKEATRLHETRVRLDIPYHDVDLLRVVWHGNYYKYFELARTQLLRSLGLDAGDLVGKRFLLMVSDSRCRYVRPLRYGDEIEVAAWVRDFRHRLCIDYEIRHLNTGLCAARGSTVLVSLDLEGRLLLKTPAALLELIAPGGDASSDARGG